MTATTLDFQFSALRSLGPGNTIFAPNLLQF